MRGKEMLLQIKEPHSLYQIRSAVICRQSRGTVGSRTESPNGKKHHDTNMATVKINSGHRGLNERRHTRDFQAQIIKKSEAYGM